MAAGHASEDSTEPAGRPAVAALRRAGALALGLAFAVAGPAGAAPIAPGDLEAGYAAEGFEGLVTGPDVGLQLGFDGVYLPGTGGAYTFASGVTIVGPNIDVFPGDAFVHDFRSGSPPPNHWGANGSVDGADDVLAGTAYLAVFEAGSASSAIELRFDQAMGQVGAFVTGDAGTTITLDAYDENGVLLESVTVSSVSLSQWGSNFLGLERTEGIWRVVFRGHDFGLDELGFSELDPVPEPSSAALLGLALAALAAARRCA